MGELFLPERNQDAMVRREWYFSPYQGMMFRYIWDFKKMRIFKNKIIFFFWGGLRPVRPGGYYNVPQISRIYTDFFFYYILSADETYSVGFTQIFRLHSSPLKKRFFLIPPSPFSQRELHLSSRSSSIVFTTPSVPLVGDRNLREEEENRPTRCSNRYAIRLADQSGLARLCGMGPPGVERQYARILLLLCQ